jgi:hypothetical protein
MVLDAKMGRERPMPRTLWKLCLAALVFVLATIMSPQPTQAVYGDENCMYESRGCPDDLHECCCLRGVFCVYSEGQCNDLCYGNGG